MFWTTRRANFTIPTLVALALSLMAQRLAPLPTLAAEPAVPQVFKAEQLTKQQFKALPDTAVIDVKGQLLTKTQIRAKAAERRKGKAARMRAATRQDRAQFEGRRAQFLQQQQAKLQTDNARVMAEVARLRQASPTPHARQREAIQQKAAQLWQQYQSAPPNKRAEIDKQAADLLKQLQPVGR